MATAPQNTAESSGEAALLAYLQEERERRCNALLADAQNDVRRIEETCEAEKARLLAEGRKDFDALRRGVTLEATAPARREAAAVASRQMGEAVERILNTCRERLREFCSDSVYVAAFEYLLREAVGEARDLLRSKGVADLAGTIRVSPNDEALCHRLVAQMDGTLTVQSDEDVWGGVILELADGAYRLHNTLASRMDRRDEELRMVATARIQKGIASNLEGVSQGLQEQLKAEKSEVEDAPA